MNTIQGWEFAERKYITFFSLELVKLRFLYLTKIVERKYITFFVSLEFVKVSF